MFILNGVLKQDEVKEFTKKDGSTVKKRIIYIAPEDSVFPIKVGIDDHDLKLGKMGDSISLKVEIYPYCFEDGKMKRANVSYYVPMK